MSIVWTPFKSRFCCNKSDQITINSLIIKDSIINSKNIRLIIFSYDNFWLSLKLINLNKNILEDIVVENVKKSMLQRRMW